MKVVLVIESRAFGLYTCNYLGEDSSQEDSALEETPPKKTESRSEFLEFS